MAYHEVTTVAELELIKFSSNVKRTVTLLVYGVDNTGTFTNVTVHLDVSLNDGAHSAEVLETVVSTKNKEGASIQTWTGVFTSIRPDVVAVNLIGDASVHIYLHIAEDNK